MSSTKLTEQQPWIQTFTGKAFHFYEEDPAEICIEDIAHALANVCRFGGHVRRFYSVAEHSVLVSRLVVPDVKAAAQEQVELALSGLLHDAAEAYLGDMVQPLKYEMGDYRGLEKFVAARIARKFNLAPEAGQLVKTVDLRLLLTERNQLLGRPPQPWHEEVEKIEPLVVALECLPPPLAKQAFLRRWEEIQEAKSQKQWSAA